MSFNPRTPARHRAKSDAASKTPLTPSIISGISNINVSTPANKNTRPTKYAPPSTGGASNPFVTRPRATSTRGSSRPTSRPASRAASPVKRATSAGLQISESLQKQAGTGVVRKGGVESKLDVMSKGQAPPPRKEIKRSKSTPAGLRRDAPDRFITTRDTDSDVAARLDMMSLNPQSASPGHTARLVAATGVPVNKRVLSYHEAPPAPSDTTLSQQREFARPLYARPGALSTSTGTKTNKTRKIAQQPERVLDAPGMVDDFYLNLLSWSCLNTVAVALAEAVYVWKSATGEVVQVGEVDENTYISAVEFSADGNFLGVGNGEGEVELWDVEAAQKLRTMGGHQGQIGTLSWNGHVLTSGCGDGSIWHHDVRIARHKVMELIGHTGEVCGLKWRHDGELLASGGNDNVVNIWDGRIGDVNEGSRGVAKWTKRNHTAAVKAIAWCPWQPSLLASGGGTNDASVNIWNSTTGARLHTLKTSSQVTSIQWSPHKKEFLTTHGYPTNSLMVHAYPSLEKVAEIRDAHDSRVLFSCIGPDGDMVCTGAGDENLKFWRIWDVPSSTKKSKTSSSTSMEGRGGTTGSGILSLR